MFAHVAASRPGARAGVANVFLESVLGKRRRLRDPLPRGAIPTYRARLRSRWLGTRQWFYQCRPSGPTCLSGSGMRRCRSYLRDGAVRPSLPPRLPPTLACRVAACEAVALPCNTCRHATGLLPACIACPCGPCPVCASSAPRVRVRCLARA